MAASVKKQTEKLALMKQINRAINLIRKLGSELPGVNLSTEETHRFKSLGIFIVLVLTVAFCSWLGR